jgi:hypothetical protein
MKYILFACFALYLIVNLSNAQGSRGDIINSRRQALCAFMCKRDPTRAYLFCNCDSIFQNMTRATEEEDQPIVELNNRTVRDVAWVKPREGALCRQICQREPNKHHEFCDCDLYRNYNFFADSEPEEEIKDIEEPKSRSVRQAQSYEVRYKMAICRQICRKNPDKAGPFCNFCNIPRYPLFSNPEEETEDIEEPKSRSVRQVQSYEVRYKMAICRQICRKNPDKAGPFCNFCNIPRYPLFSDQEGEIEDIEEPKSRSVRQTKSLEVRYKNVICRQICRNNPDKAGPFCNFCNIPRYPLFSDQEEETEAN